MLQGIVIKAYNGYYYVQHDQIVTECKLRGRLKQERYSLVVGDKVLLKATEHSMGIIEEILPRQSMLMRPIVSNITQVIIVFAAVYPNLDVRLIDKFLVLAEASRLAAILCINKLDLADQDEINMLSKLYSGIGYQVYTVSARSGVGIRELQKTLYDKVTVFSGPSGVGKSTILNAIEPGLKLATGTLSEKIGRGKHTTCFTQLLPLSAGGFIVDTPGFSLTEFVQLPINELADCFPEMIVLEGTCKFGTCLHHHEPQCTIKNAVGKGIIARTRYQSYLEILNELNENKKGY